jgi:hypothetical protein
MPKTHGTIVLLIKNKSSSLKILPKHDSIQTTQYRQVWGVV